MTLDHYAPVADAWDEAVDADGTARPGYRRTLDALLEIGPRAAAERTARFVERHDIRFGDDDSPFVVDPVPRIIDAAEWRDVERGLAQRARALDRFAADAHGPRRSIADGVVPADVVDRSPFVEPDLIGLDEPPPVIVALAGLDLVRDQRGRFRVLEDNARAPSGLAYLLAARRASAEVIGVPDDVAPLDAVGDALRAALRATVPATADPDGAEVLLSDGPSNTAWWEHRELARLMDVPIVTPDELRLRGRRLELRDGGRPVRAVYRRTDPAALRTPDGRPTADGALLGPAIVAGSVGVMNGYGAGVADDKALYPHVPDLIRYFCGEEPLMPDVPVHDLGDAAARDELLERPGALVFKPRDGQGGAGVVIGPRASTRELREVVDRVRAEPTEWIAQDAVVLSTHPTAIDGELRPRHVDLRPFVAADGDGGWCLLPGALTRVALDEGQMVVNSSRGGGGKDTWVLG